MGRGEMGNAATATVPPATESKGGVAKRPLPAALVSLMLALSASCLQPTFKRDQNYRSHWHGIPFISNLNH